MSMGKKIAIIFFLLFALSFPSWADDMAIVKGQAESIYSKRFSAENHDVKIEELRSFLSDHLYALLDRAYNHPAPDTNGLEFDPFENAQDTWESYAVQTPVISGNQASVTILLSGMGGNNTEKTEVYLQFAKRSDGRWVIEDIFYPGGGFNLVKLLSEDDPSTSSPNVETATVNANSGVSLRKTAGRSGEKLATLPLGSVVTVISKDGPEDVIEGKKARWFCVSFQAKQGWVFGGFLDIAPLLQQPSETSASAPKDGDQIIAKVKASYPSSSVPHSLGYTLDSYCDGNQWRYFTSKIGQDMVEYSGSAKKEFLKPGEETRFCIQYQYDPNLETTKVVYFEMNGEKQPPGAYPLLFMTVMNKAASQRKAKESIPDKVE